MTQPDVYIGFTPTLAAGHGNHQHGRPLHLGGRQGRGRPDDVPGAARPGPNALSTWQVKKVFSGGARAGAGGTTTAADCTTGFAPGGDQHRHRRRRLDRLRLAVPVAGRQRPGPSRGHAEDLGAGRLRGRLGLPDAEPHDEQGHVRRRLLALRHDRHLRAVPAQRRTRTARPTRPPARTTRSSTARRSPTRADCRSARSSTSRSRASSTRPGTPFTATLNLRSGAGTLAAGTVALTVPAGWTVDSAAKPVGAVGGGAHDA